MLRHKAPVTDTFEEVRGLVHYFIEEFHRQRSTVDKAELVSAAYLGFMQAYDTYKPSYGEFSTWVGFKVKKRLMDVLRGKIKHDNRKHVTGLSQEYMESFPKEETKLPEFDAETWLASLTPDARRVATLVLLKPIDIRLLLGQLGLESAGNWRQAIREFLSEVNWTPERIKKTFQEIKDSLK